jgi:subtilisin family serine protease
VTEFDHLTGRGVRVAIIDSGVYSAHPHIQGVAGGVAFDSDGSRAGDYIDRLGHGTAVTAAIRDQAPGAELFAVKVFDRALSTRIDQLVAALTWAATEGMHIANLSLGTPRREHEETLRGAVDVARSHRMVIVAARQDDGIPYWPGCLDGVLPVEVDWNCSRREFRVATADGTRIVRASGLPREIPGVPPSRNLHGVSFAVANATGFVARAMEGAEDRSVSAILERLERWSSGSA